MQELLEQIVKGIVNNPGAVTVVQRESVDFPGLIILEVEVEGSDKGILIGRRGRTINAIRDLITISAIRNNKRVKVLVKEDGNRPVKNEQPPQQEEQKITVDMDATEASAEVEDILNDEV